MLRPAAIAEPRAALSFGAADAHAAAVTAGSGADQASKLRASATAEAGAALDAFAKKTAGLVGGPPSAGGGRVAAAEGAVHPYRERVQRARTRRPCGASEASAAV